jgi:NitT/TauT family transport system substrate-binding protein
MEENNQSPSMIVGIIFLLLFVVGGAVYYFYTNQKEEESTSGDMDEITLQLKWVEQAQFMGYLVADAQGYYEDENIDIEIKPGGVGINPVDVLAAGEADVAVAWTGNVLPAITKGEDLVNFGQGMQRSGLRLMAKKSSGIESPEDIEGKRIGTWPGGNELEPYAFIEKQGLDRERDVTLISQGFDMNQLLNDELDLASAMIYNEYWLPIETGEYTEDDFVVFDMEEEGVGMLQDGLFVKREFLENNKDLLTRFLRATMKGWDYAITHQTEAVDMMGIDFTENDVTARDHQILSAKEVARLYAADAGTEKGLFYIDKDKLDQTVDIAEAYVEEVEGINVDEIFTVEIWEEAVNDMNFNDYSSYL